MSRVFRVLHVIPSISPKRGGPSAAILPMVRSLVERGIRAEIATTNDDGVGVSRARLHSIMEIEGAPVRHFQRLSPPLRALREHAFAADFVPWLKEHVRDYDLIHAHGLFSYLPTAAMRIARQHGVRYVSRPLGLLGKWPMTQHAWRKRAYLTLFERRNLRAADAIHFTSESERQEAVTWAEVPNGAVIPHGLDLPVLLPRAKALLRQQLGLDGSSKIILYLGRLHEKKGLDLLLSAFARLGDSQVILAISGDGDPIYLRELDGLIGKLALGRRVIRTGFVSGSQKQLLLQGADIFALTSRHENFGLAVLEALAAGTPVLVSEQVALSASVKKFRLGEVVPMEVGAVGASLARMVNGYSGSEADRLREFVREFHAWTENAQQLEQLYRWILERPYDADKHTWMKLPGGF